MIVPYTKNRLIDLYNHSILEYKLASNQQELDMSRISMSNLEGVALQYYGESLFNYFQILKKSIVS